MDDSTKDEILQDLDDGEETFLVLSGALPLWVKQEYDPSGEEVAELMRYSDKSVS